MKMTLRWFSKGTDSVKLCQIKQIPCVDGVVSSIDDIPVGEIWSDQEIKQLKYEIESSGLKLLGIESVNVHDAIKIGAKDRDRYIENYISTLENLGKNGIRLVCYNFMPVFDWMRTDLNHLNADGSFSMAYRNEILESADPFSLLNSMRSGSNGFTLPGWEPDRLDSLEKLLRIYDGITAEELIENLIYFLKAVMPVCRKYNIKMAVHPDDPPWQVFGLPRVIYNVESVRKVLYGVDDPHNCLTFCTGSLGALRSNDLLTIAEKYAERIAFAHLRNIHFSGEKDFEETAHPTSAGSLDMYKIVKALMNGGFDGIIRPDHGRAVWGEQARPGYGLYDRAMGACYLYGLWEAIEKNEAGY